MIQPTYCSFEQAKLLKAKGFEGIEIDYGLNQILNHSKTPEQWQIIEWLRLTHNIWINVKRDYHNGALLGFESIVDNDEGFIDCGTFDSPQEAYSAAFDYILKELI